MKQLFIYLSVLFVVGFWSVKEVKAQQDPMYTQYMNNILSVNPAYAGSGDVLSLMVMSRNQWVAFEGAPSTQSFVMHSPITRYHMGVGFSLLKDQLGPISQTGAYVDYSYSIDFDRGRYLSFGLKGGVNFYEAGLTDLETVDSNDPVFSNDVNRNFLPNVGVGLYYNSQRFVAGFSVPKLIRNDINSTDFSSEFVSKEKIHLFFMAGYVFDINRILKFKPYFLTKYVQNAPVSVDLTAQFLFYEKLWLGAMYRVGDALGGMMQVQITNQLKVGYSYDITATDFGTYNNGTHEILVSYDFNFGRGKIMSPRYF
ncbi:type IX secretion system membrane protein PorP/SprF [Sunxiuqinia elliptica]|uniref:Type IX secretion system PorP/SprF family membrane protein n=1 Tax=Sunxiuqinia elliptica TaxID=655355 RepID=A0A4R6H8W4_9BACT|nr:type IX secretion system membrane protein PorP/SprF [Sunxiuqinia elliptica]TDO04046.1 type IX secretion system PorP/SprF family membrane protein [Sunxiuqinia elliptica]TDO62328.1 type IX secretion system PorP/SprF family membrane protein [Sunxiuqinia elliptica]